jgi:hypothetical protein
MNQVEALAMALLDLRRTTAAELKATHEWCADLQRQIATLSGGVAVTTPPEPEGVVDPWALLESSVSDAVGGSEAAMSPSCVASSPPAAGPLLQSGTDTLPVKRETNEATIGRASSLLPPEIQSRLNQFHAEGGSAALSDKFQVKEVGSIGAMPVADPRHPMHDQAVAMETERGAPLSLQERANLAL